MNLNNDYLEQNTLRHYLKECGLTARFGNSGSLAAHRSTIKISLTPLIHFKQKRLHFPSKSKVSTYLHMAGAPSQLELFDYKPALQKLDGQDCPNSLLEGKKFAFIRGVFKMLGKTSEV